MPFSTEQSHLIDQAIQYLLAKAAIEKVSAQQVQQNQGFYSSMFIIPKKNGGVRQMETIREVSQMIRPNNYLVSIDLSDAFLHIALHPVSRQFLRLKWKNQVYQYCTTPFGLAPSPFVFTKVCRPILEYFRSQAFRVSTYLDDWILVASTKQLAIQQVQTVVALLQQLGWMVNFKKSVSTPTQQFEHLGFILNTNTMTASLPMKKLCDIRSSINLTMRIQVATFAIFPTRLYTRHLLYYKNQTVKSDKDWDLPSPLDPASIQELNWCWQNQRVHDYWTLIEAAQSINWRELKAARLALKTFRVPKNSTIFIRTNNTTSLSYINKHGGTRSLPLLELATEVWNWCLRYNIMIQAQHISGIYNTIADMESRRTYFKNQWQIKSSVFEELNKIWGPFTIDLFADRTTKLLPRYVSWLPDPDTMGYR
ncbi:hypothetical protein G6F57_006025 [Rhizopus arrhizus]|uniref:Reverse transcriptase domain-containing protein n=1 Tax=Rhizopus oryzae TaxID=64495 RepID=A0A9P7BUR9_RHIOR|nr:hypothetical protein G6F30_010065 [Rhizopus arrhizus]KAG1421016.1 hypothetical protein G6F58_003932 [Rhizopus delemar]KAG0980835.1 hypothetical protein G6F29_007527 [Rhizopus arrhizus]KAG0993266.1 hypothetical protein G6F28_006857 [Rhizopus arrhizus]KAG1014204.1 hypothetical protein G6F27_001192 [Rhizopus arrhizus]